MADLQEQALLGVQRDRFPGRDAEVVGVEPLDFIDESPASGDDLARGVGVGVASNGSVGLGRGVSVMKIISVGVGELVTPSARAVRVSFTFSDIAVAASAVLVALMGVTIPK